MSGRVDALRGAAAGDEAARAALARWILEHPARRDVPVQHRQDILHDVVSHFLVQAPHVLARLDLRGQLTEARLDAYLRTSIHRRWLTVRRRKANDWVELSHDVPDTNPLTGIDPHEVAMRALARVEAHVLEHGPGRREDRERTLDELKALATGRARMVDLVDREARDGSDTRLKARDRLYVRHRRMREALLAAADEMRALGRMSEDDAQFARVVVELELKRRQTGDA